MSYGKQDKERALKNENSYGNDKSRTKAQGERLMAFVRDLVGLTKAPKTRFQNKCEAKGSRM